MAAPLQACVLHQHDWSESSLILELFTREQGRVVVVAKGAKRPHSNFRAVLLPFQRLHVALGRLPADGEVQTLRSAEWGGGRPMLSGAALFAGLYLNELLMKLLARHDPHPALFDAYVDTLGSLPGPDDPAGQAALRAFELRLLRETGVLPELDLVTQTQQPVTEGRRYALTPEGVAPAGDAALPAAVMRQLEGALAGRADPHEAMTSLRRACQGAGAALRSQLRACLHYHLGSSDLRTRRVMREVQQFSGRRVDPAASSIASDPDTEAGSASGAPPR